MKFLLDTNIVIWAMREDERLGPVWQSILIDPENELYLSAASVWEMQIKASLGKLKLPDGFDEGLVRFGFRELAVRWEHARATAQLPFIHKDPFDRLLLAQAISEGLVLISGDATLRAYGDFVTVV